MNLSVHKMLGGPAWMARPKKQHGARVNGRTWYSAEQLVTLGWDEYCCATRLEALLVDIESLRPKERGGILFRMDDELTEFRFPSRQWAKRIRDAIAIIYVRQQLEKPEEPPPDAGQFWQLRARYRCFCEQRAADEEWERSQGYAK